MPPLTSNIIHLFSTQAKYVNVKKLGRHEHQCTRELSEREFQMESLMPGSLISSLAGCQVISQIFFFILVLFVRSGQTDVANLSIVRARTFGELSSYALHLIRVTSAVKNREAKKSSSFLPLIVTSFSSPAKLFHLTYFFSLKAEWRGNYFCDVSTTNRSRGIIIAFVSTMIFFPPSSPIRSLHYLVPSVRNDSSTFSSPSSSPPPPISSDRQNRLMHSFFFLPFCRYCRGIQGHKKK